MRIVIDTSVLLISASRKSSSYWLFAAFEKEKFEVAFATEMLAEYDEKFAEHWTAAAGELILSNITNAPNAVQITIYYRLNLITHDSDDNKFADCAFASNADYLVTNDSDFDVLKKLDFPLIQVVSLQEFRQILLDRNLIEP